MLRYEYHGYTLQYLFHDIIIIPGSETTGRGATQLYVGQVEYIAPFFDRSATKYYTYDVRNFEIINRRDGESLRVTLLRAITLFGYFASSEHARRSCEGK